VPLPAVTEIQEALLVAVQEHPNCVVTVNIPLPPEAATLVLAGDSVAEQVMLPGCVIVKGSPETLIVPERCGPPLFDATE
jgi:hypothetical protein